MIVQKNPVHDTLYQVISLLQTQCLAMDTALDPNSMWGVNYMPSAGLELAIKMLVQISEDVERI